MDLKHIKSELGRFMKEPRGVFIIATIFGVMFGLMAANLNSLLFVLAYIVVYVLLRIFVVEKAQSYHENREELLRLLEQDEKHATMNSDET